MVNRMVTYPTVAIRPRVSTYCHPKVTYRTIV